MVYVAELEPGIPDETVQDTANREQRKLLTADKDFGELVFRQGLVTYGVILIRLSGLTPESKARVLSAAIEERAGDLPPGTFAVVSPGAIRIRKAIWR